MERRKVIRIQLPARSAETLSRSLLQEWAGLGALSTTASDPHIQEIPALQNELPADEPHLTAITFIEYTLQTLAPAIRERADRHIEVCDSCRTEAGRMIQLCSIWSDEGAIRRIEGRLQDVLAKLPRGLQRLSGTETGGSCSTDFAGSVRDFVGSVKVSLKSLLLPQVAFGEGKADETVTLRLPVTENGAPVEALEGVLTRTNREYYILVREAGGMHTSRFADRKARITLTNANESRRILQRKIDVGVVVLLGTMLPLTEDSEIEAHLLPYDAEAMQEGR